MPLALGVMNVENRQFDRFNVAFFIFLNFASTIPVSASAKAALLDFQRNRHDKDDRATAAAHDCVLKALGLKR